MNDRRREIEPRIEHLLMREYYNKDVNAESMNLASMNTAFQIMAERYKNAKTELDAQAENLRKMAGFSADLETQKSEVIALEENTRRAIQGNCQPGDQSERSAAHHRSATGDDPVLQ